MDIYRAEILHFVGDGPEDYAHFPDGLLIIENGHVSHCGAASDLLPGLPSEAAVKHYPNSLIIPGLIDVHVHYPQLEMIAAFGEQLLEWLEKYTYPTELHYSHYEYSKAAADVFLRELFRNGTTTALVFPTVHKASVDAFFTAAAQVNARMFCGKVLMDRNGPEGLLDTPASAYDDSVALIEQWHGHERLRYAVTPRFAPTCTDAELSMVGKLLEQFDDVLLHTHIAENQAEVAWVKELFPKSDNYLDVYDRYGLVGDRSIFAHGVHLTDAEFSRLGQANSTIACCPSSNLFMGSGLFNFAKAKHFNVRVGFGTDVGAGNSLSLLNTMNEAYKVSQLQHHSIHSLEAFHRATLGGAKAVHADTVIGNFDQGKEADFCLLDLKATPLLEYRLEKTTTLEEKLFALMMLGDDRLIQQTVVMGKVVHQRDNTI